MGWIGLSGQQAISKRQLNLEPVCCKKQQKSPNQETGLGNWGHLKVLNDAKLVLNEQEWLPESIMINLVSFRASRGPLFLSFLTANRLWQFHNNKQGSFETQIRNIFWTIDFKPNWSGVVCLPYNTSSLIFIQPKIAILNSNKPT